MADTPLPNIPYRTPMLDETGMLTQSWGAFFRELYKRVGEANALSNIELAALISGSTFQAQINALTATVAANKAVSDQGFKDLGQGPVL